MDVAVLRPSEEARPSGQHLAPKAAYSNQSSLKLYSLLRSLHEKGGYSHTFGALDPIQVIQMAAHLSSIYVSGWQCSSTASSTNGKFFNWLILSLGEIKADVTNDIMFQILDLILQTIQ